MVATVTKSVAEPVDRFARGPFVLHTPQSWRMNDDQLLEFCGMNKELQIERDAQGSLVIMAPEGFTTGVGSAELATLLNIWCKKSGKGRVVGSSGGFLLPNGAMRSPDVSWVSDARLKTLTQSDRKKFAPLCPDFVIELLSPSDTRRRILAKMEEYLENGAKLGWMIDPSRKEVLVYRPGKDPEILENPKSVSGEPVLKGFRLDLSQLWARMGVE